MKVLERQLQHIHPQKWAELNAIDAKYNEAEAKFGFPKKRRYQALACGLESNTLIIEREWESMAVFEATYEKAFADAEYQKLGAELDGIVLKNSLELYAVL